MLLLVLLAMLAVYAVARWTDPFGTVGNPVVGPLAHGACPAEGSPSVDTIGRARLNELRQGLRKMMFYEKGLRAYEQGPVSASSAWSDQEPGRHTLRSLGPREPGGYEMRWWMPNGDDVGADVLVFANTRQAHDFFLRASSSRCRPVSVALPASFPPGGRNLQWRNPDGFAQGDVFLLRTRRVYRVSVVRAGATGSATIASRNAALSLVDGLACALPDAACRLHGSSILAAVRGHGQSSAFGVRHL
jgi:surface antigen